MLPAISAGPNHLFYDGKIQNSAERTEAGQMIADADVAVFLDHQHQEETDSAEKGGNAGSKYNRGEVDIVMKLLEFRVKEGAISGISQSDVLKTIGIVAPYKTQVKFILTIANDKFGRDHGLEVSTVETFQGREKDTIILSLVRSNTLTHSSGVALGFVTETRRACVALTRAKNRLYIVGNGQTPSRYENVWFPLINEYKEVSRGFKGS